LTRVSKKSARIATMIEGLRGGEVDPHYAGDFECFNQQLFYEAHDVLEELWLAQRREPNDLYFKGLIQLAGAFVHLQKKRLSPAAALFRLARTNLTLFAPRHEALDVDGVLELIARWLGDLEASSCTRNPLETWAPPRLSLEVAIKDE
jgi:predicted metal-dependent hydrolase